MMCWFHSGRDMNAESSTSAGFVRHRSIVGSDHQSAQLSQQNYANAGRIILLFVCLFILCRWKYIGFWHWNWHLSNSLIFRTYFLAVVGRLPGVCRLESSGAWSRQSMLSSSSQLRSARSSLSSRISHYLPTFHGGSARSSITSPFCLPTPLSTRSNSPNNGPVGEVSVAKVAILQVKNCVNCILH